MADVVDEDLYRRAAELLAPGEIELEGAVVHTEFGPDEESLAHRATVEIGDVIADHVTDADTYVYSGNDDERFGLNQHQALTLSGDEFVWECQQLLRDASFDVVFYWEATDEHAAIVDAIREEGFDAVGVTEDGSVTADDTGDPDGATVDDEPVEH
jgi:hypothetical protein